MPRFVAWIVASLVFALAVIAGEPSARAEETSCADAAAGLCADEPGPVAISSDAGARVPSAVFELVFFWGVGCPHCEEAKPFVDTLERERPDLRVVRVESRKDPEGRRRFVDTMNGLGASAVGVPTFVVEDRPNGSRRGRAPSKRKTAKLLWGGRGLRRTECSARLGNGRESWKGRDRQDV